MSGGHLLAAALLALIPFAAVAIKAQVEAERWGAHPGGARGYWRDCLAMALPLMALTLAAEAWLLTDGRLARASITGAVLLAAAVMVVLRPMPMAAWGRLEAARKRAAKPF